ncbi:DUF7219 family protein [Oxynema aestuarii]|jgi:hypothetical protein|uniref:Isopropylmalate/homocitrate/citramalate synthases n=1 Tax=Oxynema aestuarii AP17 TaxID=2064643 RepID=A0A6H1U306_9CYAN|nr:hypothetical protein [Oxynema aestuarii]QIZ73252.1 hypothetical protein HCG48_23825 [Oxynema aestuarii AP17]RMH76116.1 MAG: hypothetical protein D6680_09610 [Cyanobacteria bacterium J007]
MNSYDFFYPRSRYRGPFTPENLVFDANLQEFAQKVTTISCLETGGKLSPEQAYNEIEALWQKLQTAKQELGIGDNGHDGRSQPRGGGAR